MMMMFVIVKVRLGREEEHREWDAREEVRAELEKEVKEVLSEEVVEDEFMFTLLCDDAVTKALRGREGEKLARLIKQKTETYLPQNEKATMLNILKGSTEEVLGDNHVISDATLNLLLDDKNILEATKALMVSKDKNDQAAQLASSHKLCMSQGKARLDFLFVAIFDDECQC